MTTTEKILVLASGASAGGGIAVAWLGVAGLEWAVIGIAVGAVGLIAARNGWTRS